MVKFFAPIKIGANMVLRQNYADTASIYEYGDVYVMVSKNLLYVPQWLAGCTTVLAIRDRSRLGLSVRLASTSE